MLRKLFFTITIFLIPIVLFAGSQTPSNTTATEVITQARAYLNANSDDPMFPSDQMLQWVNDGLQDIVEISHCLQTTEQINLIDATLEYQITTDYMVVKAIHYINSSNKRRALIESDPDRVGKTGEGTTPKYWYDFSGKIGVFPVLSSVSTQNVILYLIQKPSTVTANDTIPIPKIYDNALVFYVAAQAWAKDMKDGKYTTAMNVYREELKRHRTEEATKNNK